MGVQLNIKDEATVKRARELATRLGKSVTATIREAIDEKAARAGPALPGSDVAALLATARALRDHWKPEFQDQDLSITHGDLVEDDAERSR